MNLAATNLNLLIALQALLEEESVGRAARRIGLSQPAMSHALQRLRRLMQDELLGRVGGRMQLTARAESLRLPLRDVLERVAELLIHEKFDPSVSRRTFRLFIADNAMDLMLPALLSRLRKVAPGVRVDLHSWPVRESDPVELGRTVDLAIACVPKAFPGFYRQRLFTDRDICVFRSRRRQAHRLRDEGFFLESGHVAVSVRGAREDPVDTWLKAEGRKRNIVLTVPHYLQALHAVARSDLIAVIPERLVRAYSAPLRLKWLPLPLDVGTFDEFLLHPARTHADPGCMWLRAILKDIGTSLSLGSG
jgi:DNA-binding transcriptional LysR family regulator